MFIRDVHAQDADTGVIFSSNAVHARARCGYIHQFSDGTLAKPDVEQNLESRALEGVVGSKEVARYLFLYTFEKAA